MEPRLPVYRGVVPGQAGGKGFMKSVNFEFLRPANEALTEVAGLAEAVLHIDPGSALTRLRGFAEEVTKAIYKEELLPRLPQATFYELLKDPVFTACTSKQIGRASCRERV